MKTIVFKFLYFKYPVLNVLLMIKNSNIIIKLFSSFSILTALVVPSFAQEHWEWRNPLPTGDHLRCILWTGSKYIACGYSGIIITSEDGKKWKTQESGNEEYLEGIAWTGDMFVIIGSKGTLLTTELSSPPQLYSSPVRL